MTVGNQIFFTLQAVMMAVSAGTTALVARAWGAEDRDEAVRVTFTSLAVGMALLVLAVPFMVFAEPTRHPLGLGRRLRARQEISSSGFRRSTSPLP